MSKREFRLSKEEREELIRAYGATKDERARNRYKALLLYANGCPEVEIEQITGCARTSLMEWCRAYRANQVQGLKDKRDGGNRAKLNKTQIEELKQMLHQHTPKEFLGQKVSTADGQFWTVKDLALVIRERYRTVYQSRSAYYRIMSLCGFSYQKTKKSFRPRREAVVPT